MGRATITGGGTDGLYTVELDLGADRIAGIVSALESSRADREAELPDLQQAADDAEQEVAEAVQAVDDAINAIDPETFDLGAVREATAALAEAAKKRDVAKFKKVQVESQISSLTLEINRLNAVETSRTVSMWCADYTEDASGEVATIEVPGEAQKQVIVPGGETWGASAGQLIARAAQTANQVYFNAAVLPGMQRHVHPWRVGTITGLDVDNDTADVTLDTETSSAQSLQVGDPDALVAVPVQYMTCNASAFEDGDRVVVDMRGPTVIGFESNPRPCALLRIFDMAAGINRSFAQDFSGPADGGFCSGAQATSWWSELSLRVGTGSQRTVCVFDPQAENFESSCSSAFYSAASTELQAISGLDETSIQTGASVTASESGGFEKFGVTLYGSVAVDYWNNAWTKKVDAPDDRIEVCVAAGTVANEQSLSGSANQFPEISWFGLNWRPIGIIRVRQVSGGSIFMRVLYEAVEN